MMCEIFENISYSLPYIVVNGSLYFFFFFYLLFILISILALRIISNFLWRGAVTWLIIYKKLILIIDKYNL